MPRLLLILCLSGPLCAQEFTYNFSGTLEVGSVSNSAREGGGNETSIGDFYLNPVLKLSYPVDGEVITGIQAVIDYVPDLCLLNYADPAKANYHNLNWIRADGYASRPDILCDLRILFAYDLYLRAGAFQTSGLLPLNGSKYYLLTPAIMSLSQHWDKGASIGIAKDWLKVEASAVDGDWTVGQVSVFTPSDSRANSTPTLAGTVEVDVLSWTDQQSLTVGATGNYGDIGSYPGEKRSTDNTVLYTGYSTDLYVGRLSTRIAYYLSTRNPVGDGSGSHTDQVGTKGYSVEVSYSEVDTGEGDLGVHGNYWSMDNDGGMDGEIWPYSCPSMYGYGGVLRWSNMFNTEVWYTEFGYVHIVADTDIIAGESEIDIYTVSTGVNF
jgi:hypothetical protein